MSISISSTSPSSRKAKTPHALGRAAEAGNFGLVRSLLASGFDPNFQDEDQWTPLMRASRGGGGNYPANKNGRFECLRILLESGANPDLPNSHQKTPLWMAAQSGHDACVASLIQAGAGLDKISKDGRTPVMMAAKGGHLECMRLLFQAGADIHGKDFESNTLAIHSAESFETLTLAVSFGADPFDCDSEGMDALDYAARLGNALGLHALLLSENHAKRSPRAVSLLSHACMGGKDQCIQTLLDAGFDPNEASQDGTTPLILSAGAWSAGALPCVQLLLGRGAWIDARDDQGTSALMAASEQCNLSIVLFLAQAGADLDLINNGGHSAADLLDQDVEPDMASTLRAMSRARLEKTQLTSISASAFAGSGKSPRI